MRILIAFDKFKDSLRAPEACDIAARAINQAHPEWQVDTCPLADGGEGFCDILTRAAGGSFDTLNVMGPRGERMTASVGQIALENVPPAARAMLGPRDGNRIVVIEMAAASGLALLPPEQRDPWQTTTFGTGELIRAAAQPGVAAILLGIGGSATNDLGLGALAALGLEFLSADGARVQPPIPAQWERIAKISGRVPADLPPIRIACDVNNPLLGARGAAAIYGPQKGLKRADHARLESASARLALLLAHHCGQPDTLMDLPGTGAAGGISFGLMAATGASLLPGFDLVTAWLDLDRHIAAADVIVTGEGRFDESSLSGKGPGTVVSRARALGKRVHVFAGAIGPMAAPEGVSLHAISPAGLPLPEALRRAPENLARTVAAAF